MTDRLVNAETLAAALHEAHEPDGYCQNDDRIAAAILAAIPPDPRLDALLEAAESLLDYHDDRALRDALAAFDD